MRMAITHKPRPLPGPVGTGGSPELGAVSLGYEAGEAQGQAESLCADTSQCLFGFPKNLLTRITHQTIIRSSGRRREESDKTKC